MGDPLDEFVRRAADAVPVPSGLETRVRATVARRRVTRSLAAVAAGLLLGLALFALTRTERPKDVAIAGPRITLTDPEPPLHLREVALKGQVTATEEGLSIRFEGARHE